MISIRGCTVCVKKTFPISFGETVINVPFPELYRTVAFRFRLVPFRFGPFRAVSCRSVSLSLYE